jgi:hypothetical protein
MAELAGGSWLLLVLLYRRIDSKKSCPGMQAIKTLDKRRPICNKMQANHKQRENFRRAVADALAN